MSYCKQPRSESLIVNNNIFEIAPSEGQSTIEILYDVNSKELAFPQLVSNGKFRYKVARDVKLTLNILTNDC